MNKFTLFIAFLLLCSFQACTEFLSPDASGETLIILSPKDSLYSSDSVVTFWWEEHEKAENYRLQMVSPDFDNPAHIFDTLVLESVVGLSLNEGRYIWRIKIENEASESEYQQRSFVLDHTAPLLPSPLLPADEGSLDAGSPGISLSWLSLDQEIDGKSFPTGDSVYLYDNSGQMGLLASIFISPDQPKIWDISSLGLPRDKFYRWNVMAIDKAGNKRQSGMWEFFLE